MNFGINDLFKKKIKKNPRGLCLRFLISPVYLGMTIYEHYRHQNMVSFSKGTLLFHRATYESGLIPKK